MPEGRVRSGIQRVLTDNLRWRLTCDMPRQQRHDNPVPKLIVRRGALSSWCGLVEANPVGSGVDELHLSAVARPWLDAWIEERISVQMQFGMERVEVPPHGEHSPPRCSVVVM